MINFLQVFDQLNLKYAVQRGLRRLLKFIFHLFIKNFLRFYGKRIYASRYEICCGPGELSRYRDSLRTGWSGDQIPMEARFSAPTQTGPGAHPAFCTMGTGSFPEVKRPVRSADHPPHLAPRLKEEYSYTCSPPLGLRGLF